VKNNIPNIFSVLDGAPEGVAIWDSGDKLVMCNEKFRQLHSHIDHKIEPGLKNQQMIQWINDAGISRFEEGEFADWNKDESGNPVRDYSRDVIVCYNNIWVQVRRNKLADGSIIAFHTDITKIKNSEERFRKIFESGPAMVSISTIDKSIILDVNEVWLDSLGYEKQEVIGKSPFDLNMLMDTEIRSKVSESLKNTGIQNVATQYRTKIGEIRDFLVSGEQIEFEGKNCILFISQEITEQKKIELKLKYAHDQLEERVQERTLESDILRQRLMDAVDSFAGGFVLYDKDDRLVICNDDYLNAMNDVADLLKPGLTFEEFLRAISERGLRKDSVKRDEKWIQECLEQHRNPTGPVERTYDDGTTFQIHEFKTREGGTVIIRTDVTALKKSERELNAAILTAEAANRAKSNFLANMSHELRTPLNAIIGFSDVLSEKIFGEFNNEKQEEYIANIHESGQHLLNLISDILDVSAIEADKLELSETDVDIADAVRASLLLVKSRAEYGEVQLINDINGDIPLISADERRMKQILVNLLSNAVKFTPEGGTVTVGSDTKNDGTKTIYVADTGIGMSNEEIEMAMEPFVQIDHDLNSTNEGTGLGLPLTKRLVEALGGQLVVESEQKIGTKVNVEFPKDKFISPN